MDVRRLEDDLGFALNGELDLSSEAVVRDRLLPEFHPGAEVTLDLAGLTFMDSTGVHILLDALDRLGPGGKLVLRHPLPPIRRVLRISGIEDRPTLLVED